MKHRPQQAVNISLSAQEVPISSAPAQFSSHPTKQLHSSVAIDGLTFMIHFTCVTEPLSSHLSQLLKALSILPFLCTCYSQCTVLSSGLYTCRPIVFHILFELFMQYLVNVNSGGRDKLQKIAKPKDTHLEKRLC